jgi:hypothetical protein
MMRKTQKVDLDKIVTNEYITYSDEPLILQTGYLKIINMSDSKIKLDAKDDPYLLSILEEINKRYLTNTGEEILKKYYSDVIPAKSRAIPKWVKKMYFPIIYDKTDFYVSLNPKTEIFDYSKNPIKEVKKGMNARMILTFQPWHSNTGFSVKIIPYQIQVNSES